MATVLVRGPPLIFRNTVKRGHFLTWDDEKFLNFPDILAPKNWKKITDFFGAKMLALGVHFLFDFFF